MLLSFTNQGFGLPEERFDRYMSGELEPSSEEFRELRHALRLAESWGGEAQAHSTTGSGIEVRLKLNVFNYQDQFDE